MGRILPSPPHFPPFHVDRRRERIEPGQEGDDCQIDESAIWLPHPAIPE